MFAFARAANTVFDAVALAVAGVAAILVFCRHPGAIETPDAHECPPSLVGPPLVLALVGFVTTIGWARLVERSPRDAAQEEREQ